MAFVGRKALCDSVTGGGGERGGRRCRDWDETRKGKCACPLKHSLRLSVLITLTPLFPPHPHLVPPPTQRLRTQRLRPRRPYPLPTTLSSQPIFPLHRPPPHVCHARRRRRTQLLQPAPRHLGCPLRTHPSTQTTAQDHPQIAAPLSSATHTHPTRAR